MLACGLAVCVYGQGADVRVTAQTLSAPTTTAMFGRLPKGVLAVAVQVCSSVSESLVIPQARIIQQIKMTNSYTILPKNAAATVVDAAQGRSPLQTGIRTGFTVVELAAIASGWSGMGETVKGVLNSTALAGTSVINVLATNVPSHAHLTFAAEMLPDPLNLAPLGCASGLALAENDIKAKSLDFGMPIRR